MERYAWKGRVKGDIAEYKRRHDEIWPEMKEVLHEAGITNYSIWNVGDELFGYYECKNGVEFAAKVQANSPVIDRWNVRKVEECECEEGKTYTLYGTWKHDGYEMVLLYEAEDLPMLGAYEARIYVK